MRRVKTSSPTLPVLAGLVVVGLLLAAADSAPLAHQAPRAAGTTVFEGARLIVADGRAANAIEDSAFVVDDQRFTAVG